MADFDDITDWWDELQDYFEKGGDEAYDYLHRDGLDVWKLEIPVAQVQEFAALLLRHEETRYILTKLSAWEKVKDSLGGSCDDTDPEWLDAPVGAIQLFYAFYEWYCMKTDHPASDFRLFNFGETAAINVLEGVFSSLESRECVDFIEENLDFNLFREDES